ncbi:hypothetical protein P389DRAFT_21797 [Cystobasidium minutum MCA 4210]|uniref:uncharacterized protein n=1 Tax=Cystobasidium minutum MCA 4210 TaxID=1397322 RepID=UPI0034CFC06A|eukprot:jgi/Rhomi1/21797/CE21796_1343
MSLPSFPFALLHIPSYLLQLKRSVFPKQISDTPLLLQEGTLVDATANTSRLARGAIKYAEDLIIWPRDKVAIFSTDPGRGIFNAFTGEGDEVKAGNGSLKTWNLSSEDSTGVGELRIEGWPEGRSFHPLGINVLDIPGSEGQEAFLAIANCMSKTCCIEMVKLSYTPSADGSPSLSATFLHSLEHPSITAPNAVVILSEKQVLFTNSFKYPPRKSLLLNTIEQFIAIPGGSVQLLTYDAAQKRTVCDRLISGIALANGLAMNKDKSILAVASSTAHYVRIYDLTDAAGGVTSASQFTLRRTIHVGMSADNLRFVESATTQVASDHEVLLCAGHPRVLEFVKTAKNPEKPFRSPSKVVKIKVPHRGRPMSHSQLIKDLFTTQDKDATTVLECLGAFYGTSSTAAAFTNSQGKNDMIVCGLFDDGILVCKDVDLRV